MGEGRGKKWGVARWGAVLVVGTLAGSALIGPAMAHLNNPLTFGHLKKHFYTKKAANIRFINVGEKASDADKLDGKNSTDFLGTTGKAADADKLDNLDSTAFQGRVHWAHVAADGSIFAQSGGLSTVHVNTGEYYVVFPISASGKAVLATGKWVAAAGTITSVILCGGAPEGATCTATGTNNTNTVYVDVKNDNGTLVDRGFYVVLFP
jgi:hypothetical protein